MQLTRCRLTVALPELVEVTTTEATLGGSIALRAARACVPFLAANAAGVRLSLRTPLSLRRRFGRTSVALHANVVARHRAILPMLVREGLVPAGVARRFAETPWAIADGRVHLFTGVVVEPQDHEIVRVGHAGNRRPVSVDVDETLLGGRVPVAIVLSLSLARGVDRADLSGEVASLVRLDASRFDEASPDDLSRALTDHARFFDEAYFTGKKRAPTRKYAKASRARSTDEEPDLVTRVARLGPPHLVEETRSVLDASGAAIDRVTALALRSAMRLDVSFDGHTLSIDADERARAVYADAVSRAYRACIAHEGHPGARLYLAKYATPHQPGEPYFFVKPPELVRTTPGASTLIVGALGDGWETMSGVIETDWFSAVPAVLRVLRVGAPVVIPAGARLATLYPTRRRVLGAPFDAKAWDPFS